MNKPNILLIMADQHRFDCLGAYGNRDILTPHLDGLSQDGVTYENSYCASPFCTPSRYSLITGMYPHQHLGWGNLSTIPQQIATFPKMLKKAGYKTKAVGKMHYTPTYLDVGFEDMRLAEQNGDGRYEDDYHRYLMERGLMDRADLTDQVKEYREQAPQAYWDSYGTAVSDLPEEHHSTTWIGERGLEALEEWHAGGPPQLLMVSFIKPHHPFDPPHPWDSMYDPAQLQLLPGWTEECMPADLRMNEGFFPHRELTEGVLRRAMAHYYGAISQIDHMIGMMIAKLKAQGLYDNTLIIYTSDHGEYMGFHHMLLKSNYMYEPLAKVPLIVKFPNNVNAGERSQQLVNNIDISPTILNAAGIEKPRSLPGIGLGGARGASREFVIGEDFQGRQYMVRTEKHKLILTRDSSKSQFFDLEADPLELNNRLNDPAYAREVERCRSYLCQTLLFDALTPNYLDHEAGTIPGEHVPRDRSVKTNVSRWIAEHWENYEW